MTILQKVINFLCRLSEDNHSVTIIDSDEYEMSGYLIREDKSSYSFLPSLPHRQTNAFDLDLQSIKNIEVTQNNKVLILLSAPLRS